ncbi:MAG: aromatic-ring-hydroxylating dioxygenase subunit beta [Halioglobus sp.]
MSTVNLTPELQLAVEQFYYQEARLLDSRQYQQWFALITEDLRYIIPSRVNVMVNNSERGNEDMISIERELEGADSDGCPIREEGYLHMMIRVERAYKMNSWSENPPARTRRLVSNVEILSEEAETLAVISNFHMHYARPGGDNYLYAGQRRDTLRKADGSYKIAHREVILDYANVDYPTFGLFF